MPGYFKKGIRLDRFGDYLGTKTKNIFGTSNTPGSNWVHLKLYHAWIELQTNELYTEFTLLVHDDIEQLERLAFWSGQLNKDVKKHIQKLKKKTKVENKDKEVKSE